MLELFALLSLVAVAGAIVGLIALVGGLVKLVFKLALLPVILLAAVAKGLLVAVGVVLLVIVGLPLFLFVLAVCVPLLVIGGLLWGGAQLIAAAP